MNAQEESSSAAMRLHISFTVSTIYLELRSSPEKSVGGLLDFVFLLALNQPLPIGCPNTDSHSQNIHRNKSFPENIPYFPLCVH